MTLDGNVRMEQLLPLRPRTLPDIPLLPPLPVPPVGTGDPPGTARAEILLGIVPGAVPALFPGLSAVPTGRVPARAALPGLSPPSRTRPGPTALPGARGWAGHGTPGGSILPHSLSPTSRGSHSAPGSCPRAWGAVPGGTGLSRDMGSCPGVCPQTLPQGTALSFLGRGPCFRTRGPSPGHTVPSQDMGSCPREWGPLLEHCTPPSLGTATLLAFLGHPI